MFPNTFRATGLIRMVRQSCLSSFMVEFRVCLKGFSAIQSPGCLIDNAEFQYALPLADLRLTMMTRSGAKCLFFMFMAFSSNSLRLAGG